MFESGSGLAELLRKMARLPPFFELLERFLLGLRPGEPLP
jgi:hypothetical protein